MTKLEKKIFLSKKHFFITAHFSETRKINIKKNSFKIGFGFGVIEFAGGLLYIEKKKNLFKNFSNCTVL